MVEILRVRFVVKVNGMRFDEWYKWLTSAKMSLAFPQSNIKHAYTSRRMPVYPSICLYLIHICPLSLSVSLSRYPSVCLSVNKKYTHLAWETLLFHSFLPRMINVLSILLQYQNRTWLEHVIYPAIFPNLSSIRINQIDEISPYCVSVVFKNT